MLNEALLRQRDDRRFCTVAYAYLETLDRGARVGFASGGHPLPLLLRADGSVESVGAPGTLLGRGPRPATSRTGSSTLEPGDALVFYTDGVIESRRRRHGVLDERRLAELVATCAGAGRRRDRRQGRGGGGRCPRAGRPGTTSPCWCFASPARRNVLQRLGRMHIRVHRQHGHRNAQGR